VLHDHKVVARQIGVLCGVCKKIKFGTKNKAFHTTIFIFLHRPQNVLVFGETLQTCLDCEFVNAKILVNFFDIPKYVF
jgi:hypothetical protein